MIVEPANLTNSNLQNRAEREASPEVQRINNIGNAGIPEAGQTSEIGPAVVTNISQATLETSRAINAPEQTAEDNRSDDIIEAQEKGKLAAPATPVSTAPRKPLFDQTI